MKCILTEKKRINELKVSTGHSNLFHEHISAEDGGPGVLCTDTKLKKTNLSNFEIFKYFKFKFGISAEDRGPGVL